MSTSSPDIRTRRLPRRAGAVRGPHATAIPCPPCRLGRAAAFLPGVRANGGNRSDRPAGSPHVPWTPWLPPAVLTALSHRVIDTLKAHKHASASQVRLAVVKQAHPLALIALGVSAG